MLESVVHSAVKEALSEINNSLQHIRAELETQGTTVCEQVQRMDKAQGEAQEMKQAVKACIGEQLKLEHKMAEMEDRSQRNKIRIIEGRE